MEKNMLKNLVITGIGATLLVCAVYANQTKETVNIPVPNTSPSNGKQMYASYCAPCHGVYGKGNGPVASALRQQPADLSVLSKNNGGKFPAEHVVTVLQFGSRNSAHGTIEMPVWGPMLGNMDASVSQSDMKTLRISNLSRYLESIQAK
jgi:mono/diheme cytochrome c family protein